MPELSVREKKILEAVNALDDAVNDMGVSSPMIGKCFLSVHPYLLDQIAKGVLWACEQRGKSDSRITPLVKKAAEMIW